MWPFKRNTAEAIGYIHDQKGILRRYKREKSNWDGHLNNTKEYITRQTSLLRCNKIAVLGSGYLLDLPLEILLSRSNEIHLYDVHHPKEIVNTLQSNDKIQFVEKDITQLAEDVRKAKNESDINKILETETNLRLDDDYDLVISLNILNQLDILLLDYIKNKMSLCKETERALRSKIQREHVTLLSTTMSILIADTEEIHTSKKETAGEPKNNIYTDIILDKITSDCQSWQWKFDHAGYYQEDTAVTFNVHAVTYNKKK